ncbi:MAG TPA: carbonic anhydrase, partial [Isosphaeraceae bacterium]|nr:carbonic anhydrase [Isosphaeraceae bacterium]
MSDMNDLNDLIDGYLHFRSRVYPGRRKHFSKMAKGQNPRFLFITCSDSRVSPHEFTQTVSGDLFIERSLGNLVPPPGRGEHEAVAAIEYAVTALGVSH